MESPITEGEPLLVPLDCEWIWHCHRLNPVQYKNDCEVVYGRILDNMNVCSILRGNCTKHSERIWNLMYPTEPFHLDLGARDSSLNTGGEIEGAPRSATEYDLKAAVARQSSFFHKLPKSIKNDSCFLEQSVARYKAFLHLIKRNEERKIKCLCVPTYDIDLVWHSHQLNPVAYSKDLEAIFGKILDHNDRDSGPAKSTKLKTGFVRTMKLWEEAFGSTYVVAGEDGPAKCGIECFTCSMTFAPDYVERFDTGALEFVEVKA